MVDFLLQKYDFVLKMILLALVLRKGVAATEPDQKHHQHALPSRRRIKGHSNYLCHFGHVLLVLDCLTGVLAD